MTMPADVCAYCASATLTGDEKPEHAIPAALGSSLTVNTVCDACNARAGREIDQPFLTDGLLKDYRSAAGQRDPRRGNLARRVSSPLLRGYTADGDHVTLDPETGRPTMGSRIKDLGEGRFQVRAESEEEAARLVERRRARAAREGKTVTLEHWEQVDDRPMIFGTMEVRTDVWRREAAKIAVAVGSRVYPPDWRTSSDALRLRDWMNDRDPSTPDGTAPRLVPTAPPATAPLARDDEHLVFFQRFGDEIVYIIVILFGTACFAVPTDSTGGRVPEEAWRLDWRHPAVDGSTTWNELLADAALRLVPGFGARRSRGEPVPERPRDLLDSN